jgi:predicted transcriptional regulator
MVATVTQSKLEIHLEILKAVAQNSPVKAGEIAEQTKIAFDIAKQSLIFLSNQCLIEANQKGSYWIARRGLAVLKHFGLIELWPQAIENY